MYNKLLLPHQKIQPIMPGSLQEHELIEYFWNESANKVASLNYSKAGQFFTDKFSIYSPLVVLFTLLLDHDEIFTLPDYKKDDPSLQDILDQFYAIKYRIKPQTILNNNSEPVKTQTVVFQIGDKMDTLVFLRHREFTQNMTAFIYGYIPPSCRENEIGYWLMDIIKNNVYHCMKNRTELMNLFFFRPWDDKFTIRGSPIFQTAFNFMCPNSDISDVNMNNVGKFLDLK